MHDIEYPPSGPLVFGTFMLFSFGVSLVRFGVRWWRVCRGAWDSAGISLRVFHSTANDPFPGLRPTLHFAPASFDSFYFESVWCG